MIRTADLGQQIAASGHDHFWRVIRQLGSGGRSFTSAEIGERSSADPSWIRSYLGQLARAGFVAVDRTERCGGVRVNHYVIRRQSHAAPRITKRQAAAPERLQDTLWRTMKMTKRFSWRDLHAAIVALGRPTTQGSVRAYLTALARVGVIVAVEPSRPGRPALYRIALPLGGDAPRVLKAKVVFDPNSNTVLGLAEASEAA